jgi:hypothetical protein
MAHLRPNPHPPGIPCHSGGWHLGGSLFRIPLKADLRLPLGDRVWSMAGDSESKQILNGVGLGRHGLKAIPDDPNKTNPMLWGWHHKWSLMAQFNILWCI